MRKNVSVRKPGESPSPSVQGKGGMKVDLIFIG
jgi:hypothetical protein